MEDILFYVDRMEAGVQVMKDLGLRSHSIVRLDETAWNYLQRIGVVNEEAYRNLMRRTEDKDSWAEAMLHSDKGFEEFHRLFKGNPKERGKAVKIAQKGYPHLKEELENKLGVKIV